MTKFDHSPLKVAILALLGLGISFTNSASVNIDDSNDVVWFPNPNGNGPLLPAKLTPDGDTKLADPADIHFYLYTRKNLVQRDELIVGDLGSVTNSNFITGAKTKLLFHGWGGSYTSTFPWAASREYLKLDEDINLILVEWGILADGSNYFAAVQNAQLVSQKSADLIEFLILSEVIRRADVHLVGFSLGGQIAGQIGSRVKEPLPRITALDPALPLFDVADLHNRTDPSDAVFVEVIHSAAILLGFIEPCGHIDWYPNGGKTQPGCGTDLTGSCAHSRAPAYFLESLYTNVGFWGRECPDYQSYQDGLCDNNNLVIMGHRTPYAASGIYYLNTNSQSPFARG